MAHCICGHGSTAGVPSRLHLGLLKFLKDPVEGVTIRTFKNEGCRSVLGKCRVPYYFQESYAGEQGRRTWCLGPGSAFRALQNRLVVF